MQQTFRRLLCLAKALLILAIGWSVGQPNQVVAQQLILQTGHVGRVLDFAISPDERLIASNAGPGDTIIWDLQTDTQLRRLGGVNDQRTLAFSPDNTTLATTDGYAVTLWNLLDDHQPPRILGYSEYQIEDLEFHPNGKVLGLSINRKDTPFLFWKLNQKPSKPFALKSKLSYDHRYQQIRFSPDGRSFGVRRRQSVEVFDFSTKKIISDFRFNRFFPTAFAFNQNNQQITIAYTDDDLEMPSKDLVTYDLASQKKVAQDQATLQFMSGYGYLSAGSKWTGPQVDLANSLLSRRGKFLVSVDHRGNLVVVDVATNRTLHRLNHGVLPVQKVNFSADGFNMLVTYGRFNGQQPFHGSDYLGQSTDSIRLKYNHVSSHASLLGEVQPDPSGKWQLCYDYSKGVSVTNQLSSESDRQIKSWPLRPQTGINHGDRVDMLAAFDQENDQLFFAPARKDRYHERRAPSQLKLIDCNTGKTLQTMIVEPSENFSAVAIDRHARWAASATDIVQHTIGEAILFDLTTGKSIQTLRRRGIPMIGYSAFLEKSNRALLGFYNQQTLWDLDSNKIVRGFPAAGLISIDSHEKQISLNDNNGAYKYDLESGKFLGPLKIERMVNRGTLGKSNRIMMCADQNHVHFFDALNGTDMGSFYRGKHLESALRSFDEERVLTLDGKDQKNVTLWDTSEHNGEYPQIAKFSLPRGRLIAINHDGSEFVFKTSHPTQSEFATYRSSDGKRLRTFPAKSFVRPNLIKMEYSNDGKLIFTYATMIGFGSNEDNQYMLPLSDHRIGVYDSKSLALKFSLPIGHARATGIACNRDSSRLIVNTNHSSGQTYHEITGSKAKRPPEDWKQIADKWTAIRIWDRLNGKMVRELFGHVYSVSKLQFSDDGKRLLSVSADRAILWDLDSGSQIVSWDMFARIADTDSHLTRLLIRSSTEATVVNLNQTDKKWTVPIKKGKAIRAASFESSSLLAMDDGERVSVFELPPNDSIAKLQRVISFDARLMHITFRNSKRIQLATCHDDGSVRLTNLKTGKENVRFYRCRNRQWLAIAAGDWLAGSDDLPYLVAWKLGGKVIAGSNITHEKSKPNRVGRIANQGSND